MSADFNAVWHPALQPAASWPFLPMARVSEAEKAMTQLVAELDAMSVVSGLVTGFLQHTIALGARRGAHHMSQVFITCWVIVSLQTCQTTDTLLDAGKHALLAPVA